MNLEERIKSIRYWLGEFEAENCGYAEFARNMADDMPVVLDELARKDALIKELTRVQAEVCPVCSATDWQYNPMRDRRTCGRCNASFNFIDGVPVYDSIAAAPVWEYRRVWVGMVMDEIAALDELVEAHERYDDIGQALGYAEAHVRLETARARLKEIRHDNRIA